MQKSNNTFRVILVIFQLICITSFIFYFVLNNQVWAADNSLLVPEDGWVYSLWNTTFVLVTIPGILSLLGFIPTIIINLVGVIKFFVQKRAIGYLVLVIESTILEFFQIILAIVLFGGRQ